MQAAAVPEEAGGAGGRWRAALRASWLWWVTLLLACAQFSLRYVWRDPSYLNLELYAHGGEQMPFQGRVLMAWVLNAAVGTPARAAHWQRLAGRLPPEIADPMHAVLLLSTLACVLAAVLLTWRTNVRLTGNERWSAWAALLVLYMTYFNLVVGNGMWVLPYDLPALAFVCLGVYLVVRRQALWLIPVTAVAFLNRETAIMIPVFHAVYEWLRRRREDAGVRDGRGVLVAVSVALQVAICVALKVWISHRFRGNPVIHGAGSGAFELQLGANLRWLTRPPQWPLLASTSGFLLPLIVLNLRFVRDRAFAAASAVTGAVWLALLLVVGVLLEIRIYNEWTAFAVPCLASMAWERMVRRDAFTASAGEASAARELAR